MAFPGVTGSGSGRYLWPGAGGAPASGGNSVAREEPDDGDRDVSGGEDADLAEEAPPQIEVAMPGDGLALNMRVIGPLAEHEQVHVTVKPAHDLARRMRTAVELPGHGPRAALCGAGRYVVPAILLASSVTLAFSGFLGTEKDEALSYGAVLAGLAVLTGGVLHCCDC